MSITWMAYFGTVWVNVAAAFAMLPAVGTMRLGSVMELVSCVVLPLSVVTVAWLRMWAAPVSLIATRCGIGEALTSLRWRRWVFESYVAASNRRGFVVSSLASRIWSPR